MRTVIATLFLASTALASTSVTDDFIDCATAAINGVSGSKTIDCSNQSSSDCFCANQDALTKISDALKDACDVSSSDLAAWASSLCGTSSTSQDTSSARHIGSPMEPARVLNERAYSASVENNVPTSVVWVTETRTDCSCKSTSHPADRAHASQIPVYVPTGSSMSSGVAAWATPTPSASASWSAMHSSHMSVATPGPSGASPSIYTFEGAAPRVNALQGSVAAIGATIVMGLMVAL
ncbi:hypothetical protein N7539_001675 [Penicillium diatomitis]|uniref:Extracellular membrane protein CFEM domain-containing protein n=1 Tax=Penicillium diatomitis TaxID=2819901 RepID=A0A9W9XHD8_9EURO|nr:uncharacterized protein N7539_001675 [Penicillium diatomitis]KAJ5492929.1 hypothetical protein N7539_001675 [Penicillium diatomitis]